MDRNWGKHPCYAWNQFTLDVTNYCNLNCPFCYNASAPTRKEFLSLEHFKIIVDKIKNRSMTVHLSGGEPLTHPDIREMVDYLIQNDIKFDIATNGTLLTEELVELLVDYSKASIQISLDGATPETDEMIRGKGHFEQVITWMGEFQKRGFQKGTIKMVINRFNYNQIEAFFELAQKYHFIPSFSFLVKSGRAQVNWEALALDDSLKLALREKIRGLLRKNKAYIQSFGQERLFSDLCKKNISYTNECLFNEEEFEIIPLIRYDGSVQPCQGLLQQEFCLGNLITQTPEEIISCENPLMIEFLEKVKRRREELDNHTCRHCALNGKCGKGCLAESLNEGDFFGHPSSCGMRKQEFIYKVLRGNKVK